MGTRPPEGPLALVMRPGDQRQVKLTRGQMISDQVVDGWRRIDLSL